MSKDFEHYGPQYRARKPIAETRTLTASMDNVHAWRLGEVAKAAGDPNRTDVGDPIDRGLILLRLLNEKGFTVSAERIPR